MKSMKLSSLILLFCLAFNFTVQAQVEDEKKEEKPLKFKPLKFNLTEDGSQWVRFILWNQLQMNTNNLEGDADLNISPNLRRSRLLVMSQLNKKVFTYIHLGVNNVNSGTLGGTHGSEQTQYFLHDAAIEYKFSEAFTLGGGLHYWNGMARLGSWAGLTSLTYDIPNPLIFIPGVNRTDQFARHMGIYAKGKINKFEYRIAVNDPSLTANTETPVNVSENNAVYNAWKFHEGGRAIVAGNLKYNFIGSEGNLLPYVVGTYLGKKETLSASIGFFSHANGAMTLISDGNPILAADDNATIASKTETTGVFNYSLDVNYDAPIGSNGGAITAYAAYLNYDYGVNGGTLGGATGSAIYGQLGYLIPKSKLQPYVAYQDRSWDNSTGTQGAGSTLNVGANYYISGHNLKLTLEYKKNSFDVGNDNSVLGLQAHIFF